MASYNRYSHHARRALTHAGLLTTRCSHAQIDTGHLLVGVMLARGSIGHQVLQALELEAERAEPQLLRSAPRVAAPPEVPEQSDSLVTALNVAEDESARLGHHYIGTEHFLLGITRMNHGNAVALLHRLDSTPGDVRRHVRRLIQNGATEFNLQAAKHNARLSELSRRVINAAEQIAVALDHPTVGLGHLLLMLLRERRSYTSTLLTEFGLQESAIQAGLDQDNPVLLVSVEATLDKASDQAVKMGSHYTGTDHLLLTLCLDPAGKAMLAAYGLAPGTLRHHLERHIS